MKKFGICCVVISILSGCALINPYPFTGNPGVDTALMSDDYTPEQKKEILRKYYAQTKTPSNIPDYAPVVDQSRCKDCDYSSDLSQCRQIASNNTNYTGNTLGSAAVGAGIGAIMGAMTGLDVGLLAGAGATGGAIGGLGNEVSTINQMVARCMQGRGYVVLR